MNEQQTLDLTSIYISNVKGKPFRNDLYDVEFELNGEPFIGRMQKRKNGTFILLSLESEERDVMIVHGNTVEESQQIEKIEPHLVAQAKDQMK